MAKFLPTQILLTASISIGAALFSCLPANAVTFLNFQNFTGDDAEMTFELFENADGTLTLTGSTTDGDFSAFGFHLEDLSSLNISVLDFDSLFYNPDASSYATNETFDSTLLNLWQTESSFLAADCSHYFGGGGSSCQENVIFDFGSGAAEGLLQEFTIVLSGVTLDDFGMDADVSFAAKIQSVGDNFEGSSKLRCYYPGYIGTTSSTFDCSTGIPENAVVVQPVNGRSGRN